MDSIISFMIRLSIYQAIAIIFVKSLPMEYVTWSDDCRTVLHTLSNTPASTNCPLFVWYQQGNDLPYVVKSTRWSAY